MNECKHNNHGHILIWFSLFVLVLNCDGLITRAKRLEDRVGALERINAGAVK